MMSLFDGALTASYSSGAAEQGAWGAEPPTFKSGGLIHKIDPHFLCPKLICRALLEP